MGQIDGHIAASQTGGAEGAAGSGAAPLAHAASSAAMPFWLKAGLLSALALLAAGALLIIWLRGPAILIDLGNSAAGFLCL